MLILYRTGRQPEALRAYQRAREVFGDLGTEPSDDLAAFEKKILLRDPTLMPEAQPVQGNLPATVSSFVGRGAEMTQIRDLVLANRLVSIVGTGGVGKTRLAIETARGLVDEFPGGVWLVEYAGIDDPEMVPSQVASTLGMPAGGHNALDDVTDHLSTTEALIIVDNCEHLADSIGRMVSTFLTHCPLLRVLATSRRPLAVQGEMMWGAAPLSLIADDTPGDQPEALRMFLERARAAKPDLALTDEVEKAAAEVCTRLAGLPLAIELAAARLRVMSVAQLSNRLDDAFALLTGGPKDKPDHQRGLRALSVEAAIVTGNFDLARRLSARMDEDEELPNPVRAWFLVSAGFAAAAAGDADVAEDILERYAARLSPGELQGMSDREIHALISLARMDLDDVEQWATAMLEQGRTKLSQWELYLALVLLGVVHFHRGDKVVARRYIELALSSD